MNFKNRDDALKFLATEIKYLLRIRADYPKSNVNDEVAELKKIAAEWDIPLSWELHEHVFAIESNDYSWDSSGCSFGEETYSWDSSSANC